jgi:hypothetical protein
MAASSTKKSKGREGILQEGPRKDTQVPLPHLGQRRGDFDKKNSGRRQWRREIEKSRSRTRWCSGFSANQEIGFSGFKIIHRIFSSRSIGACSRKKSTAAAVLSLCRSSYWIIGYGD